MRKLSILTLSMVFFILSCNSGDENTSSSPVQANEPESIRQQFDLLSPDQTGIDFNNLITEDKEVNHLEWDAIYYGGGVGIGDINNDGLQDIFFCGNQVNDALYLNKGNFEFEDISQSSGILESSGWSNGVSFADVNGDGNQDIYVCRSSWLGDDKNVDDRKNLLYINNGDNTFSESAENYGLANTGYSTQSAWLDYDHDGDLDMFLLNAPSNNLKQKVKYNSEGFPDFCSDKLFRNDGNENFTDVSKETGTHAFSFGLGVIANDLNHDGWTDIYVANDYERPDYFYINNRDGTFSNELNNKIKHTCYTAMGVDAGDINNDALIDLAVLDMQSEDHFRSKTNMPTMQPEVFWEWVGKGYNHQYMTNVLQVNNAYGYFSDISQIAGVASTDWSWSVLLADYDNDGWKDMYVTNGINKDIRNNDFALEFERRMAEGEQIDLFELSQETPSTKISNYMFHNKQEFEFEKTAEEWGLGQKSFSYGAAYGDLDNDGDLDIVVNNNNMNSFVYQNNSINKWMRVACEGDRKNKTSLGTKAIIFYGDKKQYNELSNTRGYQSSSEQIFHFGLGAISKVDSLVLIFPDGRVIKKQNLETNKLYSFSQKEARKQSYDVYGKVNRLFAEQTEQVDLSFSHQEDNFDDYKDEILLPHRQSRNGPFICSADVNNDGRQDFYIGGAAGQAGELNIQQEDGSFKTHASKLWNQEENFEDLGCEFLDVDGDGDQDLYIVSGGSHLNEGDELFSDRLYINDGEGNFDKSQSHRSVFSNGSCVEAADIDGDGDVDLFVGGRGEPGLYPNPGTSYILMNEGGQLINKTNEIADGISNIGMVTDASWADIDGDGDEDLLIVGEWMSPTVYINHNGILEKAESFENLSTLAGWWFSCTASDIDGDGLMDFTLGNIGMNNKFHASKEKPLKVYGGDFDHNGSNDIVLSKLSKGKYVPARGRQCSSEQVPFVSDKYENYESFASASIEEVYGDELNSAIMLEVTEFHSGILHNTGGGFEFIPFPNSAQISPVMGCYHYDFNKDGIQDILIAGNHFDAEVETTRYDAGNGLLLLGKGDMEFDSQSVFHSGFYTPGNVKSMHAIQMEKQGLVLVGVNNNRLRAYSFRN